MTRVLALIFACSLSVLAADVAGKWNLTAKDPDDVTIKAELMLEQKSGQWAGSVKAQDGTIPLRKISFDGTTLRFTLDYADATVDVEMMLEGNVLKGSYTADQGPTGPIEATRSVEGASSAAGVWNVHTVGPDGGRIDLRLTLKQNGSVWTGDMSSDSFDLELTLDNVRVDAEAVSFRVPTDIGTYVVAARVSDGKLEGTATDPDGLKNPINGTR